MKVFQKKVKKVFKRFFLRKGMKINQSSRIPEALIFGLMILLVLGLSSVIQAATPNPGYWYGITSRGFPMSFEVSSDSSQVIDFKLKTDLTGMSGVSGWMTITLGGALNITDGQFSGSAGGYSVTGQFATSTAATGTYTFDNYKLTIGIPWPPYIDYAYFSQSGEWTASLAPPEPFGFFDTPIDGTTGIAGAIPVTGWALDDVEPTKVEMWRDPVGGEPTAANGLVYIGDAVFVEGARPDIEDIYPAYPTSSSAGWGYMMLTNFLPNQGNGTYTIHAIVYDEDGHGVELGTKTITCDNANAVKPFGTIDTPTQGGEVSGDAYVNFGWALTPQPNSIATDGSTIQVWIDGESVGNPEYNQYREDIATLFPGYGNSGGAVGYYYIDTTYYDDEVHTIAWSVEDSAANVDGIGSRYFSINNSVAKSTIQAGMKSQREKVKIVLSPKTIDNLATNYEPIRLRRGYTKDRLPEIIYPDNFGVISVEMREVGRIELNLGESAGYKGYTVVGEELRSLPIGSTLDTKKGIFYWQPGPGFIGGYDFIFIKQEENGLKRKLRVRIKIMPSFNLREGVKISEKSGHKVVTSKKQLR